MGNYINSHIAILYKKLINNNNIIVE